MIDLSEKQLDELSNKISDRIERSIVARLDANQKDCGTCATPERRQSHRQEHEFIQQLMGVANQWNGVRWELVRDTLKWANRIIITAVILGLLYIVANRGIIPR